MNQHIKPAVPFRIEFTTHVIFRDCTGRITHEFHPGDTFNATHDTGIYFVTCLGGVP